VALKFHLIVTACCLAASSFGCSGNGNKRISVLAEYLHEEHRLRQAIPDPGILEDSIDVIRTKYGIDPAYEIERLHDTPDHWLDLLRKLKRGP